MIKVKQSPGLLEQLTSKNIEIAQTSSGASNRDLGGKIDNIGKGKSLSDGFDSLKAEKRGLLRHRTFDVTLCSQGG